MWSLAHAMPGLGWGMLMASLVFPVVTVIRRELVLKPPMSGVDKLVKCISKTLVAFKENIRTIIYPQ